MAKWNWEIGLIREKLIDKINSADFDTLLVLEKSLEQPKKEILEIFSTEKLKDKSIWKEESKLAKDLLKFMKSIYKDSKDNASISEEQRRTFSPEDPLIKEFLDKSGVIKKIGLRAWVSNLRDMNVKIWFMDIWVYKLSINEEKKLILDIDDWDI